MAYIDPSDSGMLGPVDETVEITNTLTGPLLTGSRGMYIQQQQQSTQIL